MQAYESFAVGALSLPIETKCLMYVNARSMVIKDQQAYVMTINLSIDIHLSFRGRAIWKVSKSLKIFVATLTYYVP